MTCKLDIYARKSTYVFRLIIVYDVYRDDEHAAHTKYAVTIDIPNRVKTLELLATILT
jgi:hypothetical protein